MKHCIAAIALTLFLSSLAHAQSPTNRGLVLTGSLLRVLKGSAPTNQRDARHKPDTQSGVYEIHLYLQFKNESRTTMIVPVQYFRTVVTFLEPSGAKGEDALSLTRRIDPSDEEFELYILRRNLSPDEPPKGLFAIIEPQAYYEFGYTVRVDKGYKEVEKAAAGPRPVYAIKPNFPALKVRFHFPAMDRSDIRDALLSAKRRWAAFGELPLNSDGAIEFVSETIINDFPTD